MKEGTTLEVTFQTGEVKRYDMAVLFQKYPQLEALSKARNEMGMTQKELSIRTGIDQSDISKIERGAANPSINTMERLAKAMDMEIVFRMIPQGRG